MSQGTDLPDGFVRQHLIDPEICIRCNTCEETCPNGAIVHDSRNYVVKIEMCCPTSMECMAPCPTGAIDNWRIVPKNQEFAIQDQFTWDSLPAAEAT